MTHYVENTGDTDVIFIEVLQADHFSGKTWLPHQEVSSFMLIWCLDISLGQWVGLTPPQIVMDTLNLKNETVSQL